MKKIILLLLLCLSTSLFAQTAKKEILLDESDRLITPHEFKEKVASPERSFIYAKFENDTAIYKNLY